MRTRFLSSCILPTLIAVSVLSAEPVMSRSATTPISGATKDQDSRSSALIAAAEPFEALTEQAFTASPGELATLIGRCDRAAQSVRGLLSPEAASSLEARLQAVQTTERSGDKSGLALASVEIYRILATAANPTKVPVAVNLLDYAGFRYDADLKSNPTRWQDMREAARFGLQQWQSIADRVTDKALASGVQTALVNMENAALQASIQAAKDAVRAELDLVDKLESYFNTRAKG